MALPRDASDADLVARTDDGDHTALDVLWHRHADAVHDHLARWTQDAELAADATVTAFTALLDDIADGTAPAVVRPRLLRSARSHAADVLARGGHEGAPVPPAVLAASGAATTSPAAARSAWAAAARLGPPWFSVLDLSARQGCGTGELATVLDQPVMAVQELLDTVSARTDEATRAAYAALATLSAPVAARTAVSTAAVTRIGAPGALSSTMRLRVVGAVGVIALAVLGIGLASALSGSSPTPTAGPATAAAQPVPSPSPTLDPSPTATLDARETPSAVPTPSPEPTAPPSPTPSPSPTAAPPALTVTIDDPQQGATYEATQQDELDRPAALVAVRATVGGAGEDAEVVWTSDLGGDQPLLRGTSGDLQLWLPETCSDATHTLTATLTDPAGDRTAAASIAVTLLETCADLPEVALAQPTPGQQFAAEDGSTVSVPVSAVSPDSDLEWRWSVDAGTVTAAPNGPEGTVEFVLDECLPERTVVLRVDVTRTTDQTTAADEVPIEVDCV